MGVEQVHPAHRISLEIPQETDLTRSNTDSIANEEVRVQHTMANVVVRLGVALTMATGSSIVIAEGLSKVLKNSPQAVNISECDPQIFRRVENGDFELFSLSQSNGEVTRLTNNNEYDGHPYMARNCEEIMYLRMNKNDFEVAIMDLDTHVVLVLRRDANVGHSFLWSPEGYFVLFESFTDSGYSQRFYYDSETRRVTQLGS